MVPQTKSAVIILIICNIITISCNSNKKNMPLVSIDVQAIPVLHSEDVSTLISDTGYIIRMDAKIWQEYSNDNDPYSYFPEGIYVERFDSLFNVDVIIKADTAYYFKDKDLWHAIGNVFVKNMEGTTFETSELFWNRRVPQNEMNAFHTKKPVKVVRSDGNVNYSRDGFTADQSLKIIRFFSGGGDFYIVESTDTEQQNTTINPDSIQNP